MKTAAFLFKERKKLNSQLVPYQNLQPSTMPQVTVGMKLDILFNDYDDDTNVDTLTWCKGKVLQVCICFMLPAIKTLLTKPVTSFIIYRYLMELICSKMKLKGFITKRERQPRLSGMPIITRKENKNLALQLKYQKK